LFKFMAGVDLTHIPYKGTTPAVTDLVAGQVQVMFDVTPTSLRLSGPESSGRWRDDGQSRLHSSGRADDRQLHQGLRGGGLDRFRRPRGTPPEIIATLTSRPTRRCSTPNIKQRLTRSRRPWRCRASFARRVRQIHRPKYRQMDQGDQVRGHQAAGSGAR